MAYISDKDWHFHIWGGNQNKIIRDYLRGHLKAHGNPNATDGASKRIQSLLEIHGENIILDCLVWASNNNLFHIKSIIRAVNNPRVIQSSNNQTTDLDCPSIEHENIRGSSYYKGEE